MISCLMITQTSRLALAQLAIGDFAAQTHAERELVIVHDGNEAFDAALRAAAAEVCAAPVRVMLRPAGASLGQLRNAAIDAAQGDFVCQWDDDDRYHPQRLSLQWQALARERADFCFLSDQLHWFPTRGELYWDDWNREAWPLNLVPGTLLGRRARMPRYPQLARGEDTDVLLHILRRGDRIARVRDAGWCYVYVYHGANTWDATHHVAISRAKRYGQARLLQRESDLRRHLAEYAPALGALRMPHEAGALDIGG